MRVTASLNHIKIMRNNMDKNRITEEEYDAIFEQSVWVFCRYVERVIRPFSTSDFEKDYFIPEL